MAIADENGVDGVWTTESTHDPFLPLAVAAGCPGRLELGTSVAIAFARTPMTLATVSHHLHVASEGRLVLGLGTQVRAHIENRFSMPWSRPAARMAEFLDALRAIWAAWDAGVAPEFRGEFYRHTLSTPFFQPPPSLFGPPKLVLGAVGEMMTTVAGTRCDGLLVHAFTTERYLREVTLPALERGLESAGRQRDQVSVILPGLIVSGDTQEDFETAVRRAKRRIAFYSSTPAYRPVLALHGLEDLQPELNRLSKLGQWRTMREMIDDDVLDLFAVVAEPAEIGQKVISRFGGLVDQFALRELPPGSPEQSSETIRVLHSCDRKSVSIATSTPP